MRLVVGLGNPGSEFVATRHNVGWEAVDELALRLGWIERASALIAIGLAHQRRRSQKQRSDENHTHSSLEKIHSIPFLNLN